MQKDEVSQPDSPSPSAALASIVERQLSIRPEFVAVAVANVQNRQTVGKDMGQALLSGALGMAAPFLVRMQSDYVGQICVVAVFPDEVAVVDYGALPLGPEKRVTPEILQALVQMSPKGNVVRVPRAGINMEFDILGPLKITGAGTFEISTFQGLPSARELRAFVYGIQELGDPSELLDKTLDGESIPSTARQLAIAKSRVYMKDLAALLEDLSEAQRQQLIMRFTEFDEEFRVQLARALREPEVTRASLPFTVACLLVGIAMCAFAVWNRAWELEGRGNGWFPPALAITLFGGPLAVMAILAGLIPQLSYRKWCRRAAEQLDQSDGGTS